MSDPRRHGRDAATLTLGSLVSGLAAYLFIAIGTRLVGVEAYAPVSIVWTIWAAAAAVITFPVQHWLIRTYEATGGERALAPALRGLGVASVGIGLVMGLVTWLWRVELFGSDRLAFPLVSAVIPVGSALTGWSRGVLAGRQRFGPVAGIIVGENALRVGMAAFLAVLAIRDPALLTVSILVGFAIVTGWPSAARLRQTGQEPSRAASPLRFMAGVAGGSLIAQLALTAGPLLLTIRSGPPAAVTSLFAAMALLRSPYLVASALTTRLTGPLTAALARNEEAARRRTRRYIGAGSITIAFLAIPFGLAWFGPLLSAVFGPDITLPPVDAAILAAGGALSVGSLAYSIFFVALDRSDAATQAWLVAIAAAVPALLLVADPLRAVSSSFLVAEAAALWAMVWLERRSTIPAGQIPTE